MIVYVLKCLNSERASFHDHSFIYPEYGLVEALDWKETEKCGNGLHAFLEGEGDYGLACWLGNEVWQVIEVETDDGFVKIDDAKVKFRKGNVIHSGDVKTATDFLRQKIGPGHPIIGETVVGGYRFQYSGTDRNTIVGGECSTVIGGNHSTVMVGYNSTVIGGNYSIVTGGNASTVTGGEGSTVIGGDESTVTGRYNSKVIGGDHSTVTGGDGSTVTGGNGSTVTGGNYSTVTGGHRSTVTGGHRSILRCNYYDIESNRQRTAVAYVGENGIEPNVPYKLNNKGEFCEAHPTM